MQTQCWTVVSIYLYKRDCLYLWPPFTLEPRDQSPPNFVQTQGRFLITSLTQPTRPTDLGITPKLQNLYKSLCNVKYSDTVRSKNFDPGSAEPRLASFKYNSAPFPDHSLTNSSFFFNCWYYHKKLIVFLNSAILYVPFWHIFYFWHFLIPYWQIVYTFFSFQVFQVDMQYLFFIFCFFPYFIILF